MRRGWKIFWIVCGAAVLIGLACCVAAWGMGVTTDMLHGRFPNGIGWMRRETLDSGKYLAEDIRETYTDVRKIDAEICAGEVNFISSSDNKVVVETKGISEDIGFKCYVDGDELKLTTKKKLFHMNNVGVGSINVYIPRQMQFEDVSLDLAAGTLYVEEICADSLSVNVDTGEAVIDDFDAKEADFKCGAGSITTGGAVGQEIDMKCGFGSITYTAAGYEDDYNYDIECGVGEVICGESSYSGLGTDKMIDNQAQKEINIECGVGSVTIDFGKTSHHSEEHYLKEED